LVDNFTFQIFFVWALLRCFPLLKGSTNGHGGVIFQEFGHKGLKLDRKIYIIVYFFMLVVLRFSVSQTLGRRMDEVFKYHLCDEFTTLIYKVWTSISNWPHIQIMFFIFFCWQSFMWRMSPKLRQKHRQWEENKLTISN